MELQPQTETGKRLAYVLGTWMRKTPEQAVDKLKRLLFTNSLKVKNEDGFVAALYGQSILDETPSVLSLRYPSTLLRVQHAMEMSLSKGCVQELVMGLELSENESLLNDVFAWTEKNSKEIEEIIKGVSSVDLAPQRVQKIKKLSELVPGTVAPRRREISWKEDKKKCTALAVFENKIIVGWDNGQIGIYNVSDLSCPMILNYCKSEARVTHLQSTGTEIIAAYEDGNICVWNMVKGILLHSLSVADKIGDSVDFATCIRWRDPKLVVGTDKGKIHIWQYVNSSFTLLGHWEAKDGEIVDLEFNGNYVIILPFSNRRPVSVRYFNGQHVRSLSSLAEIICITLQENHLITVDGDGMLKIWDVRTGNCVRELKGDQDSVYDIVDSWDGVVVTRDDKGKVIIWCIQAILEGRQAALASFTDANFGAFVEGQLTLGTNFVAGTSRDGESREIIMVTDFPS